MKFISPFVGATSKPIPTIAMHELPEFVPLRQVVVINFYL